MKPTERFTSRVADYTRYRPSYPDAVIRWLETEAGLARGGQVADIGAGTGISAELFLRHGYRVTAVEPNAAMREQAIQRLSDRTEFSVVDGTGEHTSLPDHVADLVLCAQAFHWLDGRAAAVEFRRIAKTNGLIVLMWNERHKSSDGLEQGIEDLLLQYGEEYNERVFRRTQNTVAALPALFGPLRQSTFVHEQVFDWEGLQGRMASASYVPLPGHPNHAAFTEGLRELYEKYNSAGKVRIVYDCEVYCAAAASRL